MATALVTVYGNAQAKSISDLVNQSHFSSLRIFEPGISGSFRQLLAKTDNYIKSFYWGDCAPGEEKDGVRNEDLMNLTFPSSSIDLVVSSDILEHVRKPWVAFKEIHRILQPGGFHIFSIPALLPMPNCTKYRVDTSTEEDVHIEEPHYHGDGKGGRSLVYTDFGADIFTHLEKIGFRSFCITTDHVDRERARVVSFISEKRSIEA